MEGILGVEAAEDIKLMNANGPFPGATMPARMKPIYCIVPTEQVCRQGRSTPNCVNARH